MVYITTKRQTLAILKENLSYTHPKTSLKESAYDRVKDFSSVIIGFD